MPFEADGSGAGESILAGLDRQLDPTGETDPEDDDPEEQELAPEDSVSSEHGDLSDNRTDAESEPTSSAFEGDLDSVRPASTAASVRTSYAHL